MPKDIMGNGNLCSLINNNNNNIIYIALYTKVLKRFTMEEETRIIKLTLPKK